MALDPKITYTAANAMLDTFSAAVNSGKIRIYDATGGIPTNADDAIGSNVLLAELVGNATFKATTTNGVLTAAAITADSSANASGDAASYRIWDSAGTTCYLQGTAGEAADTTNMTLNEKTIQSGANVSCSALTVTLPRE